MVSGMNRAVAETWNNSDHSRNWVNDPTLRLVFQHPNHSNCLRCFLHLIVRWVFLLAAQMVELQYSALHWTSPLQAVGFLLWWKAIVWNPSFWKVVDQRLLCQIDLIGSFGIAQKQTRVIRVVQDHEPLSAVAFIQPIWNKSAHISPRIIDARELNFPRNILVCLIKPLSVGGIHLENVILGIVVEKSISVFKSYLGFPVTRISIQLRIIIGERYTQYLLVHKVKGDADSWVSL
jgi:hypothetical protein